jgi:hypothetical protein
MGHVSSFEASWTNQDYLHRATISCGSETHVPGEYMSVSGKRVAIDGNELVTGEVRRLASLTILSLQSNILGIS